MRTKVALRQLEPACIFPLGSSAFRLLKLPPDRISHLTHESATRTGIRIPIPIAE